MDAYTPAPPRSTRRRTLIFAAALAAGIVFGIWSFRAPDDAIKQSLVFGGTVPAEIRACMPAAAATSAAGAIEAAYAAIDEVGALMNAHRPESDIGRLNAAPPGDPVRIAPATMRVLLEAARFHRLSDGAFDVTVMPLVALYKPLIRAYEDTGTEPENLPAAEAIAAARAAVGARLLELDPKALTVTKRREGMRVDLGAIAKGYAVDAAMRALVSAGATAGFVNIGGEVRILGTHPEGRPWNLGITDPTDPDKPPLPAPPGAVAAATSGQYRQFFMYGGTRHSHIVDPRSGMPLTGALAGVTILSPTDCLTADALATAVSVLGIEEGKRLLTHFPGTRAIFQTDTPEGGLALESYPDNGPNSASALETER